MGGGVTEGEWETQRSLEELSDCDVGLTHVGDRGKEGWVGGHRLWYSFKTVPAM